MGIKDLFATSYKSSSNGCVALVYRTIDELIRTITDGGSNWVELLRRVLIVYNSTLHSDLSMYPSQFLLTRVYRARDQAVVSYEDRKFWRSGRLKFVPIFSRAAVAKTGRAARQNCRKMFSKRYQGPLGVDTVNANGVTYVLRSDTEHLIREHQSQLIPWVGPPTSTRGHITSRRILVEI